MSGEPAAPVAASTTLRAVRDRRATRSTDGKAPADSNFQGDGRETVPAQAGAVCGFLGQALSPVRDGTARAQGLLHLGPGGAAVAGAGAEGREPREISSPPRATAHGWDADPPGRLHPRVARGVDTGRPHRDDGRCGRAHPARTVRCAGGDAVELAGHPPGAAQVGTLLRVLHGSRVALLPDQRCHAGARRGAGRPGQSGSQDPRHSPDFGALAGGARPERTRLRHHPGAASAGAAAGRHQGLRPGEPLPAAADRPC